MRENQSLSTDQDGVAMQTPVNTAVTAWTDTAADHMASQQGSTDSPLARARKRHSLAVAPLGGTVVAKGAARSLPTRSVSSTRKASSSGSPSPTGRVSKQPSRELLSPLTAGQEQTLKELLSEPMDYVDHPEYHVDGAETRIYAAAEIARPDVSWYRPLADDSIAARNRATRTPKAQASILLTGAQERVLFMKYNFARFQVSEIQHQVASRTPTLDEAHAMLRWHATAMKYREQLAETNLGLVLAMSKRLRMAEPELADLIGEGNMALMRSVDKFDCGRGFKFSTYGCRAILKAFSRHGIKATTHRKRFGAEFDPAFEKSNHLETVRATHERECADEVRHIVLENKADLSEIELQVIGHRFGLTLKSSLSATLTAQPPSAPLTLEQVGQVIGVTKERVRQIQNRALEKIRHAVESANPAAATDLAEDIATREGRRATSADYFSN